MSSHVVTCLFVAQDSDENSIHFEIEKDNEWRENLYLVQLACREIRSLDSNRLMEYYPRFHDAALLELQSFEDLSKVH